MARLGENIRACREARGWSQAELARRSGVQFSTINALETGQQQSIRADRLQRLADALSVGPAALLDQPSLVELADEGLDSEFIETLRELEAGLSPEARAALIATARQMHRRQVERDQQKRPRRPIPPAQADDPPQEQPPTRATARPRQLGRIRV